MTDNRSLYEKNIQDRSQLRYILGLVVRAKQNIKYLIARKIARTKGAKIGCGVIMPISLAKRLNNKVEIGNHVSIQTTKFLSFKYPIKIGNNVIIGEDVKIVMESHNLNSYDWEFRPNKGLTIEDYVWLCPDSVILPSCKHIGYGAVIGANAVVFSDVPPMAILSSNPAQIINKRKVVHKNLVVESLLGGDYSIYRKVRKKKRL